VSHKVCGVSEKNMKQKFSEFNELEKLRASISIHRNPDILIWDYTDKIDVKKLDSIVLDEFNIKLNDISYFLDKIFKYQLYFYSFYPETKEISNSEALTYHIHSYLQDITILRNKLNSFLGFLKNKFLKISLDKKTDKGIFDQNIERVEKTFKDVVDNRNDHHHNGFRFLNSDIVDSEMCTLLLAKNFPLKNTVNVDIVSKKEIEYFEKAKNDYIQLAKENNKNIIGLINEIFSNNKNYIYKILNIRPIDEIMDIK